MQLVEAASSWTALRERKPHPRVAIVTNRPARYRKELFDLLAESWDLEPFFTARHCTDRLWPRDQQMIQGELNWHRATSSIALWKGTRDRGFDCVISWFGGRTTLMAVTCATRACRTPFVLWADMWEFSRTISHLLARPLEIRMLRSADAILANGMHMNAWIERVTGRRDGVFTAPHAVDNAAFRAPIDQSALKRLREKLGLDGGTSFNSGLSSALGILGDLGLAGTAAYAALYGSLFIAVRRLRSPEAVAATGGWAMWGVLGLVFDWWEQPPLSLVLAVLSGLALTGGQR